MNYERGRETIAYRRKADENVLSDMKKLLVEKTALKQTTISSNFVLDKNCEAALQDILVVMTSNQ